MKTVSLNQRLFVCAALLCLVGSAWTADDRVKIENDEARVLVVTSMPGEKSQMHEHKVNRVMIYLDAGKMTLTDAAGKVDELKFKANEVLWSPATGPHVSQNVSDHPVRIVEVELKKDPAPRPAKSSASTSELDWVKVDPRRYKVELDNGQVQVVRARYGPHEKGALHEHPFDYVVAFVTDAELKVTPVGGEARTGTFSPGDVRASGPSKHVEENMSDKPIEVVVVEFKK